MSAETTPKLETFLIVAYKKLPIQAIGDSDARPESLSLSRFKSKARTFDVLSGEDGSAVLTNSACYLQDGDTTGTMKPFNLSSTTNLSSHPDPKCGHILSVASQGVCRSFTVDLTSGELRSPVKPLMLTNFPTVSNIHRLWSQGIVILEGGEGLSIYRDGKKLATLDSSMMSHKPAYIPTEDEGKRAKNFLIQKDNYFGNSLGNYGRVCQVKKDILFFVTKYEDLLIIPLTPFKTLSGTICFYSDTVAPNSLDFLSLRDAVGDQVVTKLVEFDVGARNHIVTICEEGGLARFRLKLDTKSPPKHSLKLLCQTKVDCRIPDECESVEVLRDSAMCTDVASTSKYVLVG